MAAPDPLDGLAEAGGSGVGDGLSSALFGRLRELNALNGMVDGLLSGQTSVARVALLSGHSGVGKSALASAALERATALGAEVVRIACEPFHDGMSFFPIREIVRHLTFGRPLDQAVAEMYGENSTQSEMAAVSESPTAEPSSRREALVGTFTNVIVGRFLVAGHAPLIIFIDDLEHLDAGSADALICLISRLSEAPVLIMGAYRRDLTTTSTHPLRTVITTARRVDGMLNLLEIGTFGERDITELTQVMLGGPCDLPGAFYDKLAKETEGNPLFIREILRTLSTITPMVERPPLRVVDGLWTFGGQVDGWKIPETVEDVIAARLDALEADRRQDLEFAAVVGRRFAFEVLTRLSSVGEDDLLSHLEQFLSFDIIREVEAQDDTFEFSHGKIRDVLYESLSGLRRRKIHARVAEVLTHFIGSTNEDWDALIGTHLYRASSHADAFPYLLRAARSAAKTGSAREAASLYRNAYVAADHAVPSGYESKSSVALELVEALLGINETDEARALLVDVLNGTTTADTRAMALNFLGDALLFQGRIAESLEAYAQCESLARANQLEEAICEVACDLAEVHGRQYEKLAGSDPTAAGRHGETSRHYVDEAYARVNRIRSATLKARTLRNKAKQLRVAGDITGAIDLYLESNACVDARVAGHRFLIPYAKALRLQGDVDEAARVVDRVMDWSVQAGSRRSEGIALQYRGLMRMMAAHNDATLEEAKADLVKALQLHRVVRFVQGIHETELSLGEVTLRLGSLEEALDHLRTAVGTPTSDLRFVLVAAAEELDANGETDRADVLRTAATTPEAFEP
ncbi:AAA ATPase-like protein [Terracoccus luteus]|uniref:AAA ATPase-like protein n=1 Tax=Terracoccus luteus TaxID=53356 RepID=A0A495XPY4_9MICO|nr:AAA family ATPase [Terracoccus luteus]RKT76661.1 AAA ATPase-like protein [Terracoccus luteus]